MMGVNASVITKIPLGLPGILVRSPMPFSPYDSRNEVWPAYQAVNIELVVVLTEPQEYLVHAKRDLPAFYTSSGLKVIQLPIPDFKSPKEKSGFAQAVEVVRVELEAGRNVAVHCMAGIGRTGIFLACLAKRVLDLEGDAAIDFVRQHVPGALEVPQQEFFVKKF